MYNKTIIRFDFCDILNNQGKTVFLIQWLFFICQLAAVRSSRVMMLSFTLRNCFQLKRLSQVPLHKIWQRESCISEIRAFIVTNSATFDSERSQYRLKWLNISFLQQELPKLVTKLKRNGQIFRYCFLLLFLFQELTSSRLQYICSPHGTSG